MYWCWGKTNKDAPGCTVGKHESRDDEDDATAEEKEERHRHIQWLCCKETGHIMDECYKDPNYKYGKSVIEETERLLHADEFSKDLKQDYLSTVTNLIKELAKERTKDNPFSIGWLKFDDYNYDYINQNVLVSVDKMIKMHNEKDRYGSL